MATPRSFFFFVLLTFCFYGAQSTVGVPAPIECPLVLCATDCPDGYKVDAQGCQTCECKLSPCASVRCPSGTRCKVRTIYCITTPCPPPRAVCEKVVCPLRKCIPCPYGYIKDKDGCQTCTCKDPCTGKTCPKGQRCVVEDCGCGAKPCPNVKAVCKPIKKVCPLIKCSQNCPNGYKSDRNGCRTCECLPVTPGCEATTCPVGEVCRLVQVQCIRAPCPPLPTCVPLPN